MVGSRSAFELSLEKAFPFDGARTELQIQIL